MQGIERTYEQISAYLKGLLSNRERHSLEKSVMQDAFDEEAFDGLNTLGGEEFDADMSNLTHRLDARTALKKTGRMIWFYRIAASLILLIGLGTALVLIIKQPAKELITQEISKDKPVIREMATPDTVERPLQETASGKVKETAKEGNEVIEQIAPQRMTIPESPDVDAMAAARSDEAEPQPARNAENEYIAPVIVEKQEDANVEAMAVAEPYEKNYVTGRVLGVNREALAGVSIHETGSNRSTLTDMNGYFKMQLSDSDARLAFNHIGYNSVEVPSKDIAGNEIMLQENLVALNEVVVVGYGTRSSARKQATAPDKKIKAAADYRSPGSYSKPVPPGGSLMKFESWVEEHIDTLKLMTVLPGNYRIRVNMHINEDGTLDNVTIKNDVPDVVVEEYKRAVMLSPPWKPATSDNLPVDAEIMIEFLLMVK